MDVSWEDTVYHVSLLCAWWWFIWKYILRASFSITYISSSLRSYFTFFINMSKCCARVYQTRVNKIDDWSKFEIDLCAKILWFFDESSTMIPYKKRFFYFILMRMSIDESTKIAPKSHAYNIMLNSMLSVFYKAR